MTRTDHLLTILAEECCEVAKCATKALRFGLREIEPNQNFTNAERILHKYADLVAALDMLRVEGSVPAWGVIDEFVDRVDAKKVKVEKYLRYSVSIGTLEV